jgi:RNA-directed DNA polymerase
MPPLRFRPLDYGEAGHDINFTRMLNRMNFRCPKKTTNSSIASLSNLSTALDIPLTDLQKVKRILPKDRYREIIIPKGVGGSRTVYDAIPSLRTIQHRINTRIFKKIVKWPSYLYGSLPNETQKINGKLETLIQRDYIACAQNHCEAKSILKLDIANFFENIHRDTVRNIFGEFFSYPDEVADYLTEICSYNDSIVQGALTSSYLAMLCLWDVEYKIIEKFDRRNLMYTRLVDDITISSKSKKYDFTNAKAHIENMMLEKDFPLNLAKTEIMRIGATPLTVHGLVVDFKTPRLPPSEVSRIRASVYNVVKAASINNYRTTFTYREQYYRCLGRVNLLARVKHNKHNPLIKKLQSVRPLPGENDIGKVKSLIRTLGVRRDKSTDNYRRIYNIAKYRIEIIARTFGHESKTLTVTLGKEQLPAPKIN